MSEIQYIAVCAIIDNSIKETPGILSAVVSILKNNLTDDNAIFEVIECNSFLRKWFMTFPACCEAQESEDITISADDLKLIATSYKIFFDDTILALPSLLSDLSLLINEIKVNGGKIIVPVKVIEAIQKNMVSADKQVSDLARIAMKNLMKLQENDLADIRGERDDGNVIDTFISVFAKFKSSYRIALFSQNEKLARRAIALNKDEANSFPVLLIHFEDNLIVRWTTKFHNQECLPDDTKTTIINNKSVSFSGWNAIN